MIDLSRLQPLEPIRSKEAEIPTDLLRPGEQDPRFRYVDHTDGGRIVRVARTIFLAEGLEAVPNELGDPQVPGTHYVINDRLPRVPSDRERTIREEAREETGGLLSALYHERVIRGLYQNPDLELVHITSGVNSGNWYPFQVFGFTHPSV